MGLNPIDTTKHIRRDYLSYLSSMFLLRDEELGAMARKQLEEEQFVKGPFIEITPPFKKGKSIESFIQEGILSKEFRKIANHFPKESLYLHQHQAVEKIIQQKRNMVVATGTGSGKTECFMIPVLDYLMKQKEKNELGPGVRILLLYPMNALANDQLKRLRKVLSDYPEITFGRYIGETYETPEKALNGFKKLHPDLEPLPNELLSRKEMRATPPHILITNYAMLEYLLIRPEDSALFDRADQQTWKFIVLDEAHTYSGAQGTEISMLLRRLKDRVVNGKRGFMQCIATSATLGGGREDYPNVAKFAEGLFDEHFDETDIIESTRISLFKEHDKLIEHDLEFYQQLFKTLSLSDDESKLSLLKKLAERKEKEIKKIINQCTHWDQAAYYLLKNDKNIVSLQRNLQQGPRQLQDVANELFSNSYISSKEKVQMLINLVDVAVQAKGEEEEAPLIPARYHTFVKALEGAYISLWPQKEVFLNRKIWRDIAPKQKVAVFELANCQRCGQEYLVGKANDNSQLVQVSNYINLETMKPQHLEYYMLSSDPYTSEFDEDNMIIEEITPANCEQYELCICCGFLELANKVRKTKCCEHMQRKIVWKVKAKQNSINTCYQCGAHSRNIVKRFLTADDPTTEVLARSLYQQIPAQKHEASVIQYLPKEEELDDDWAFEVVHEAGNQNANIEYSEETGRKLLIFSDSRREAAFFATFMDIKYHQYLWRKLIIDAVREIDYLKDDLCIDDIFNKMKEYIEKHQLDYHSENSGELRKELYGYLMRELMVREQSTGIEGLGLVIFAPNMPVNWPQIKGLMKELQLSYEESWTFYNVLLDTLRAAGAMTYPEGVSPTDEIFEPRNKKIYFGFQDAVKDKDFTTIKLIPGDSNYNTRLDYVIKILRNLGLDESTAKTQGRKLLKNALQPKIIDKIEELGFIEKETLKKDAGIGYRLNYKKWIARSVQKEEIALYRCNRCGRITPFNLYSVCMTYRCDGALLPYDGQRNRFSYYKTLYDNIKPIPLKIEEHTAQLSSTRASELQADFEKGKVNILSCSTTFEMGVDVGQLEAVFMRNIPPQTANYVQRAGRAGRRTESTAYSLTYAKRRSHDLTYFREPEKIISGKIQPPYVEQSNERILRRHLHSVVFAWFFKKYSDHFRYVNDFFKYLEQEGESVEDILDRELNQHPQELFESLCNVIPPFMQDELGVHDWSWVKVLLSQDQHLIKSKTLWTKNVDDLTSIIQEKYNKGQNIDSFSRMRKTYLEKRTLDFLASNNILPKYGFPVDSVNLDIITESKSAPGVELSRDLKMAISEFAPGGKVIAGGRVWTSYAINRVPSLEWPTFVYAICSNCRKNHRYKSSVDEKKEEYMLRVLSHCTCGTALNYHKYIKPIFGFSTNTEKPNRPTENKDVRSYATQVFFDNYDGIAPEKQTVQIGDASIGTRYSSRGKMFLVNQGIEGGFRVCTYCGFSSPKNEREQEHKNKRGGKCSNKWLSSIHLGHDFMTDVLELDLPRIPIESKKGLSLWYSILYALLDGASDVLGIARNEIDGCLDFETQNSSGWTTFILFDVVAGGAGHVKRIAEKLDIVFHAAWKKVNGGCGCGEDTSCYGCLRNYGNQLFHDILERGLAKQYLEAILVDLNEGLEHSAITLESEEINSTEDITDWLVQYCAVRNITLPEEIYELFIDGRNQGTAEWAWETEKVAFFSTEQKDSYDNFKKFGWNSVLLDSYNKEELEKSIQKYLG